MEGRGGYQNKIITKNKSNTCEELTKHSHFGINNNIQFNYIKVLWEKGYINEFIFGFNS